MRRPPVFTNRCCKLVSYHFPIGTGSASRRHKFPRFIGDKAQLQPHLVGAKAVTGKPHHRDRLLALFDPLLGCPTLVGKLTISVA